MIGKFFAMCVFSVEQALSLLQPRLCLALALFVSPMAVSAGEQHDGMVLPEQMAYSVENALDNYRIELESMKKQLESLEEVRDGIQAEINSYVSQNTAHSQLLLESQPRIENLENAIKSNWLVLRALNERVDALMRRMDSTGVLLQETAERIELAKAQMEEVRSSQLSDAWKLRLEESTRNAIQILEEKQAIGKRILQTAEDMLDRMNATLEAKKSIGQKLAARLESEKTASVFERFAFDRSLNVKTATSELGYLQSRVESIFHLSIWKERWMEIKMGGFEQWAFFFTALALIVAFMNRCRKFLRRAEKWSEGLGYYYRWLALTLLRRSLPFLGLSLFFGFYSSLRFSLLNIHVGRVLFSICLMLLLTQWGMDYLKYGFRSQPPTVLKSFASPILSRFFRAYRTTLICFMILILIAGRDSLATWMVRGLISAALLAWFARFWRDLERVLIEARNEGQVLPQRRRLLSAKALTYLACGGTLLLNLLGYRVLGGLWFTAWNKTAAICFWGWIGLNAVREWREELRAETAASEEKMNSSRYQLRLSLIQLATVLLFLGSAAGILYSWDPTGLLRTQIGYIFDFTVEIGKLKLNAKGVIVGAAILFTTHYAVRIGRNLLKEKILDKQSFERGLEDSILTVTNYLGWGLGILLALGTIGVDTTSLAVVFGALSIGIGFGLQNICNNFISGLILLVERPIQVGDVLEFNGLWVQVKKINVRATVVKTFDNAAVIIPNSDLISKQVINWSFKDKRMRRNIDVGSGLWFGHRLGAKHDDGYRDANA